ncbi:MAG: carbamoyltransferase HypF, partial [Pseudomonadota bacterium]
PFAVMALNCTSIEANLAQIRTKQEFELLNSPTAPIVLLPRLANSIIVPEVAPNLAYLGVMLANNPWHYLLFYYLLGQPSGLDWLKQSNSLGLIVTSANFSGGTIISDNYEAEQSLASIADYIVAHDRDIIMKSDDSLVEFIANQAIYLRRSRGLAPQPFQFNYTMPSVLGLGCQLKNSITFIRNNQAFVSQYLGDMASVYTIDYFKQVLAHYQQIFSFTPQLVVSDLHPDAYVTIYAQQLGIETLTLQHHFAHFASVIANAQSYQRNLENSLLGCILDGYGYGDDGEAWGGELIHYSMSDVEFKLISQLPSLRIIGGDIAELEPWRIALAWCVEYNLAIPEYLLANRQANLVVELIKQKHGNLTTSLGRNFSGIAALLNVITQVSYEGQAAMVLESLVTTPIVAPDLIYLDDKLRPNLADLIKLVYQIGVIEQDSITAINIFYGSLAKMLAMWISQHAKILNISQVAISGGCWQSKYLLALVSEHLANLAIELIIPQNLPVNDECISFGQAWYGAQLLLKRGNKI